MLEREQAQAKPHTATPTEPMDDLSATGTADQIRALKISQIPATHFSYAAVFLHPACARGDLEAVRAILSRGGDILYEVNEDGQTALHLAATNGYYEIVELILNSCSEENLRYLLNMDDKYGYTPYYSALKRNPKGEKSNQDNEKTATYLLARNKQFAVDWHKKRTKKYNGTPPQLKPNDTHLHLLIHNDFSLDLIRSHLALLASYSRVANTVYGINEKNQQEVTPLHLAAVESSPELVKLLLAYKANLNSENQGYRCLHIAVETNKHENVKIFLDHATKEDILKEDTDKSVFYLTSDQKSVFHIAAESADIKMLELLSQHLTVFYKTEERTRAVLKWILSQRDKDGNTVAHLAAQTRKEGSEENYPYLISLGAKVSVPNNAGKTAEELFTFYTNPPRPPSEYSVSPKAGAPAPPSSPPVHPPLAQADVAAIIPGAPEAHSNVAAYPGNIPLVVPAAPENNPVVNSANGGEQKPFLQRAWALISKKPFKEWVYENRVPIAIGGAVVILAVALSVFVGLSIAFPGSSFLHAIPIVSGVHAAFEAFHISTTIPWIVPAVSISLPVLAIPFEIAIIYNTYVAATKLVNGISNLFSSVRKVFTQNTETGKHTFPDYNQHPSTKTDVIQVNGDSARSVPASSPSHERTILQADSHDPAPVPPPATEERKLKPEPISAATSAVIKTSNTAAQQPPIPPINVLARKPPESNCDHIPVDNNAIQIFRSQGAAQKASLWSIFPCVRARFYVVKPPVTPKGPDDSHPFSPHPRSG